MTGSLKIQKKHTLFKIVRTFWVTGNEQSDNRRQYRDAAMVLSDCLQMMD